MSKRCILCLGLLIDHESPEHVLLNAFGGRLTTRDATCTTCNHRTNELADSKFANDFVYWRTYLDLKAGDGDPPPMIRGLQTADGIPYDLAPGGRPIPRDITFDRSNPGRLRVSGAAERLGPQISNFAKGIGISAESFAEGIRHGSFVETATSVKSKVQQFALSALHHFQSVTKSALILWGLKHGNDEVCHESFDAARRFALGEDAEEPLAFASDYRPLPVDLPQELEKSPFDHVLIVWSGLDKAVYCHMRILGFAGYSLRIGTSETAPSSVMLWVNPVTGSSWRGAVAVTPGWRLELEPDVETAKSLFAKFRAEAWRHNVQLTIESVVNKMVATYTIGGGIPTDRLDDLIRETDALIARMFVPDASADETLVFARSPEQILQQLGLARESDS